MDDCKYQPPTECCCCDAAPSSFTVTIGAVTAECEFDQCGQYLDGEPEVAELQTIDPFDQVLQAVMQSFAHLGPNVSRVVISEPTPDGPITYLDRSRDGDATPPSMAEIVGE